MTEKFQNDINNLVKEFNFKGDKFFKLIIFEETSDFFILAIRQACFRAAKDCSEKPTGTKILFVNIC